MLALGDHRVGKALPANVACEGQLFFLVALYRVLPHIGSLAVLALFNLLVNLPTMLVVPAIMEKLASVTKAAVACFFVVFANVRLVVPAHGSANVGWCSQRPFGVEPLEGTAAGGLFSLIILMIPCLSSVDLVIFFF